MGWWGLWGRMMGRRRGFDILIVYVFVIFCDCVVN